MPLLPPDDLGYLVTWYDPPTGPQVAYCVKADAAYGVAASLKRNDCADVLVTPLAQMLPRKEPD